MTIDIQKATKESIKELLLKYDIIQLVGPTGSGRMYTAKLLNEEYHVLEIGNAAQDDSLQIIKNALFDYRDMLSTWEISHNASVSACSVFSLGWSIRKKSVVEDENALIKKLNRLSQPIPVFGKITPVIIAIRKEVCSQRIINFLKLAVKKLNSRKIRIKIIYLTDYTGTIQDIPRVDMQSIGNSKMDPRQILLSLNLHQEILDKLSDDEISFIFRICMNNFTNLTTIVRELNDKIISFKSLNDDHDSVANIINSCFTKLNIAKSKEIIIYCSHADKEKTDLTQGELEYLLGVTRNGLNRELEGVQKLHIIKSQDKYIKIIIDLVKKIALEKSNAHQFEIYKRFNEMLSYMYPSDYATKYKFALNFDPETSAIAKLQYNLQQVRLRRANNDLIDLPEPLKEFYNNYASAINYCIKLDYTQAVVVLQKYCDDKNPIVRAEASLVIAQAWMKSLDESQRTRALNQLETIDLSSCDGNLQYRILMCRMSAYIHKGQYTQAIKDYNTLYQELHTKISLHPSDELKYSFNVLLRKANMVYNFQAAKGYIIAAKKYFKNHANNFTDYFYALCNCLCSNIENMDLSLAQEDIYDYQELQFNHADITFKRQYIFDNNKYLYDYFCKKNTAAETAEKLLTLFNSMRDYADRFLIANNYAVFLALSGNVEEALKFLKKYAKTDTCDDEGVYEYRSVINSAIMEFILDNSIGNNLADKICRLKIDHDQPNKSFKEKEMNHICKIMRSEKCNSVEEWKVMFENSFDKNRPLNIFEQCFVITPLSNWDDD